MLKKLTIQNYALIDSLEVSFEKGLNILTGETGAGKSIILGALGLVMGDRADLKAVFDPNKNCMVEASIDIQSYDLQDILKHEDVEAEDEILIRRVILKGGKSRAFINDLPVSLKTLQNISIRLIQVHNQFDNLDLSHPPYQLKMMDALAGNEELLSIYRSNFELWQKNKKELARLKEEVKAFQKEKDFIQFQYDELSEVNLEAALEEDIESQLEVLSNAEAIQQALKKTFYTLTEDDNSILTQLNLLIKELQLSGNGAKLIEELVSKMQNLTEDLRLHSDACFDLAENTEHDPGRIENLQTQLDHINKLLHKHKLTNIADLLSLKFELEQKLEKEFEVSESISLIKSKIEELGQKLSQKSSKISLKRKKAAEEFSKTAIRQLKDLAMPYAMLSGSFIDLEDFSFDGKDEFELLFTANKGKAPESIKQVASGGELSRLSLTIKSIIAGNMSLPTLIFDEIEAGISGEVALKMGKILKELSAEHQVINITHSAQIASRGDRHFFVYKSHEKDKSVTKLKTLDKEQRIIEIAKMLSGDPPSPKAIENAKELIHLN